MPEKRINNTIFLMFLASCAYTAAHGLTNKQFIQFDKEHGILNYIAECPDVFDSLTEDEMVREIDDYVSGV